MSGYYFGAGIVTEATLRMRHRPEHSVIARVSFDSVHDAANAVIQVLLM